MRILEPEAMMSEKEVKAYDLLVKKYLKILHAGFVETVINSSPPDGTFLDVGTGTGWIAIGIAKYNPNIKIIGIDLSETMLKLARVNAHDEGVSERINFQKGDAKCLLFENETFDAVFCHNMLHHLPEPMLTVKEMLRVMKKDGSIIIRDLKRYSKLIASIHVTILGLPYNRLMKKEYKNSILAALSEKEWIQLFHNIHIPNARLTEQFITHMTIEKQSPRRRSDYIKVPVPFYLKPFKNFYVSKSS